MNTLKRINTFNFKSATVTAMRIALGVAIMATIATATHASSPAREVKAPRGGEIRAINDGYVEVVNTRDSLKIFIYDKNLKVRKELKDISIIAEVQRSTSKDLEDLELKPTQGGYTAKFKADGIPKFYLDIGIADRKSGHADRLSFDFESTPPAL